MSSSTASNPTRAYIEEKRRIHAHFNTAFKDLITAVIEDVQPIFTSNDWTFKHRSNMVRKALHIAISNNSTDLPSDAEYDIRQKVMDILYKIDVKHLRLDRLRAHSRTERHFGCRIDFDWPELYQRIFEEFGVGGTGWTTVKIFDTVIDYQSAVPRTDTIVTAYLPLVGSLDLADMRTFKELFDLSWQDMGRLLELRFPDTQ